LRTGIDQFLGCFDDQLNVRASGQATFYPLVERKKNIPTGRARAPRRREITLLVSTDEDGDEHDELSCALLPLQHSSHQADRTSSDPPAAARSNVVAFSSAGSLLPRDLRPSPQLRSPLKSRHSSPAGSKPPSSTTG
jgi:hypothetical protein